MKNATIALVLTAVVSATGGCSWRRGSVEDGDYMTVSPPPNRDTTLARKLTRSAVELIDREKLDDARDRLKSALAADLFFGPAHNNLGTVYLKQKKYYLAAWEFQYAAKLMPDQAEPRNNLGMVFETVGHLDQAAQWYDKALALSPDAVEIAGNLARINVRRNRRDERTKELLAMVVMKDKRPEWVDWAREHLALIGRPKARSGPRPLESLHDSPGPDTRPAGPVKQDVYR